MNKSQAIKLKCLECSGGSKKEVTLCHLIDCPLWCFRFGYSMNDRRYEERMKAAKRNYPDEFEEIRKLVAEYKKNGSNSSENEQIDGVLTKNLDSMMKILSERLSA